MGLILTSFAYLIVFLLLTTKELVTDEYDHDIDQFMYFGSRILNGELAWTKEFDDKSPVLHYIFSLPALFKDTSIFVIITLIVSLIAVFLGFLMLKNILLSSNLNLNNKNQNSILLFGTILYMTLLAAIYGSLHHINAISSSLCLISISITYFNKNNNNKFYTTISAISSAIAISIRPYYILNLISLPLWISARENDLISFKKNASESNKYLIYLKNQLDWILRIVLFITLFNLTPYFLTGNLSDFFYGMKLNSIDYVNQNILQRQYINIGRNPILYPLLIGMIILPFMRIFLKKNLYSYYQKRERGLMYLDKLDIDIIFFGIISPILLEIMFLKKHFFGHYFTLFSPYIFISIVLLLAISTRINILINDFNIFKTTIKSIFIISLITCLITNQSMSETVNKIFNKRISDKSYKLELIKEFIVRERKVNKKINFLAPNDNYIHWQLNESRHGFPQKAVFRNITEGKLDNIINNAETKKYKFLLPTKDKLCNDLNLKSPEYIITERNDYTFNCMLQESSNYKLITSNEKLVRNNIYIFKRYKK